MGITGRQRWGAADGGAVPGRGRCARDHSWQRGSRAGPGEHRVTSETGGVWKGTDDIRFGANQGSAIKSDFSNVTIVNSLCVGIPGKYDHHLHIMRGDMRSFLHVKLSVRHWSLPVSVTMMSLTFLNVWYDQCVFVCICVCM